MSFKWMLGIVPAMFAAFPAMAEDQRDLCPDRPGLGTPACTVSPGTIVAELGVADWTRTTDASVKRDTVLAGEALVRIGLTETLEAQVGWAAFGYQRERDRLTGAVTKASRVGDVTVALRQNLHNPDGSGFSLAVMPYASLPIGREPIGAGDWAAGVKVPLSVELNDSVAFSLTPQLDAMVDGDGKGRHLGYGSVAGLEFNLSDSLSVATEVSLYRDRDPEEHQTLALAGLSAAWQSDDDTQFDLGVNLGLNRSSPDTQIYAGITRRF